MRPFGELEAAIMGALWERGTPATVMTVMDNLHRKGQLTREMNGRAWLYRPVRTRAEHAAALLQDVLSEAGDRQEVLMHFVADLDPDSVTQLRSAVEGARRHGRWTGGGDA